MSFVGGAEGGDSDMTTSSPNGGQAPTFQPFTKAERIQQLSEIDKSITQLLKSAGLAMKTLTACQNPSEPPEGTAQDYKTAFTTSAENYLTELHSVNVRLKRQVNGLKEAGIIAEERKDDSSPAAASGFAQAESNKAPSRVNLDVGWLNSRSRKVGTDMEAELWAQAKAFLEEREKRADGDNNGARKDDADDMMQT